MKQTGVKKYRRTAAMLAATFTALLAVSSFSFAGGKKIQRSHFVLEEIPLDMLKDQMDRDLNAPATYAQIQVLIYPHLMICAIIIYQRQ